MTDLRWIFGVFDAGALLLLIADITTRHGLTRTVVRPARVPVIVTGLLASYVAQLAVVAYAAFHQTQQPPAGLFPLPLGGAIVGHKDAVVGAVIGLAVVQSYLLLRLYRADTFGRWVWIGSALLLAISLLSPVMVWADAYAYVADALLGRAAYAPPDAPFVGQFAPIYAWWGIPFPPSPYGPLWLAVAWLVTAPFGTLLGKVMAIRLLGAGAFAALLLVMRRCRTPDRIVAVTALNPGILFEYVTNGHNDLFGIVLLSAAALAVRRPAIAMLFAIAGGLVKLPFAVFGLPVLASVRSKSARMAALFVVPVTAAALTFAVGGAGYYRALLPHMTTTPVMAVLSGAVAIVVLVAIVATLFHTRRLRSIVWLIPLAASYTLSSYTIWGLPYALTRRNVLGYLLVGFPLVTTLLEVKFFTIWSLFLVVPMVVAWQVLAIGKR